MIMSDEEIVKSFKEAAYKGQQIGILADLNDCNPSQIHEVLERNGVDFTEFVKIKPVRPKRGRPVEAPKIETPKVEKTLSGLDLRLNELIIEGIHAVDVELQKYQEEVDRLSRKKQLLQKAMEDLLK